MKTLDVIKHELRRQAVEDGRLYLDLTSSPFEVATTGPLNLVALAAAIDTFNAPPSVSAGVSYLREVRAA